MDLSTLERVPIAKLNPQISTNSAVHGVITLVWPYSSVTHTISFLLVEPDFRLRRFQGQIRVTLRGSCARRVTRVGLLSGDEITLALEGGKWQKDQSTGTTPGRGIEWELVFSDNLRLERKPENGETQCMDTSNMSPSPEPTSASGLQTSQAPTAILTPDMPDITPRKHTKDLQTSDTWASPVFLKSSRLPDIFPSKHDLDPFLEDDWEAGPPSKKARFGRKSDQWRFADRSPSPEKSELTASGNLENRILPSQDLSSPTFLEDASLANNQNEANGNHMQSTGSELPSEADQSRTISSQKFEDDLVAEFSLSRPNKVVLTATESSSASDVQSPKLGAEQFELFQSNPNTDSQVRIQTSSSVIASANEQDSAAVFRTETKVQDTSFESTETREISHPIFENFITESIENSGIPETSKPATVGDIIVEEILPTMEDDSSKSQTHLSSMLQSSPNRLGATLARQRSISRTPEPDLKISIMAATPLVQPTTEDLQPLTPRLQPLASPGLSIVSPIEERRPQRSGFFEAAFLRRTMPNLFVNDVGSADVEDTQSDGSQIALAATAEPIGNTEPGLHQDVRNQNQADTMFNRLLDQYDRGTIQDTEAPLTEMSIESKISENSAEQSKADFADVTGTIENMDYHSSIVAPSSMAYLDETQHYPGLGSKEEIHQTHRVDMLLDEAIDSDKQTEAEAEEEEEEEGEEHDEGAEEDGLQTSDEDIENSSESEDSAKHGKHRDMTYKPSHGYVASRSPTIESQLMTDHLESQHSSTGLPIVENQLSLQQDLIESLRPGRTIQDTYLVDDEEIPQSSQMDSNEHVPKVEIVDLLNSDSSSPEPEPVQDDNLVDLPQSKYPETNNVAEQHVENEHNDVKMQDAVSATSEIPEQDVAESLLNSEVVTEEQTADGGIDRFADIQGKDSETVVTTRPQPETSPGEESSQHINSSDYGESQQIAHDVVHPVDTPADHTSQDEAVTDDIDSMQQEFYTVPTEQDDAEVAVSHAVATPVSGNHGLLYAAEDVVEDNVATPEPESRQKSRTPETPSQQQNDSPRRTTRFKNRQGSDKLEVVGAAEKADQLANPANSPESGDLTKRTTRSQSQQLSAQPTSPIEEPQDKTSLQHEPSKSPRETRSSHRATRSQSQQISDVAKSPTADIADIVNETKPFKKATKSSKITKVPQSELQDSLTMETNGQVEDSPFKPKRKPSETSKLPTQGFRTAHDYYATLPTIGEFHGAKISLIAIVVASTKPTRAATGPRDYNQTLYLASPHSRTDSDFTLAQLFRPFESALPYPIPSGAVILLKDFKVQSYKRKMSLLSTDTSAWAFFDQNSASSQSEMQVTIAGPPVKFAAAERGVAWGLGKWWSKLDTANKERISKSATEAANTAQAELERKAKAAIERQTPSRRRTRNADSQSFSQEGITTIPNTPATPLTMEKPHATASTTTRRTRQSQQTHESPQELSPTPTRSQPSRNKKTRSATSTTADDDQGEHQLRDGTTYTDKVAELATSPNRNSAPESAYAHVHRSGKAQAHEQQSSFGKRTRQGLRSADAESQNSQLEKHELRDGKVYSDNEGDAVDATADATVAAASQGRRSKRVKGKRDVDKGVWHELRDGAVYKD